MTTTTSLRARGSSHPSTAGPAVEVRGLAMSYGDRQILHGVDFTVEPGSITALLGPNGAGKTTTMEILEGFRARSGGHVRVLGVDPEHGGDVWRASVGIVLQSWRDHGRWTVRRLLAHVAAHYAPFSEPDRARPHDLDDVLGRVGLTAHADTPLRSLSGGQRRRVDVALGIIGNPRVLFLDEPTAGLDPQARREFLDLVRRQANQDGTTVLITTHDLHEASELADRIIVLAGGRIVADGSEQELGRELAQLPVVVWEEDGHVHRVETADTTAFVRELTADPTRAVRDLTVQHPTLEDVYLALASDHHEPLTKGSRR